MTYQPLGQGALVVLSASWMRDSRVTTSQQVPCTFFINSVKRVSGSPVLPVLYFGACAENTHILVLISRFEIAVVVAGKHLNPNIAY